MTVEYKFKPRSRLYHKYDKFNMIYVEYLDPDSRSYVIRDLTGMQLFIDKDILEETFDVRTPVRQSDK